MNSGIYIRVNRENILLEDMDENQRHEWLDTLEREGLIRTIDILCNTINNIE